MKGYLKSQGFVKTIQENTVGKLEQLNSSLRASNT